MISETFVHEWYNQTTLHPVGVAAVVLLGLTMLIVPRRWAIVPMLLMACFIASAQRVVILTLDFNLLRVMVLFGWLRLIIRGEMNQLTWKRLDTIVVLWAVTAFLIPSLYHSTAAMLINRAGLLFDALGMYFLFRFLVRDWSDVVAAGRALAVISIPVAIAFLVEKATGRNMFHVFGGVPEMTIVRAGRLRCQGAFAHPILAGSFWAVSVPLIASLWWQHDRYRFLAPTGMIGALLIVASCTSSTPLCALGLGLAAACLFPLRHYLAWVRAAGVVALVLVQLAMMNPIWHLLARIDFVGGSMGWYRYKLIDEFVQHFGEWWLAGTDQYAHWWVWGLDDITNQYVAEGVAGGLLALVLFAAMIFVGFRSVGRAGRHVEGHHPREALSWGLGVSLFIHCIAFIGVTYFGQIIMLWYLTLAMIGSMALPARRSDTRLRLLSVPDVPPLPRPATGAGTLALAGGAAHGVSESA